MKQYMTKEAREKISNRLTLNFGILLCGALIMLYIYNFVIAGYAHEVANVVGIVGILSAIAAAIMFILGKKNYPKVKNYSAIFLGMFVAALIVYLPKFAFMTNLLPAFTTKTAVVAVLILMLAYFIVLAIVSGIILKTHPEAPAEKKKIQHAKSKKKRK